MSQYKLTARLSDEDVAKIEMIIEKIGKLNKGDKPAIATLARKFIAEGIDRWFAHYQLDVSRSKRSRSQTATSKSSTSSKS